MKVKHFPISWKIFYFILKKGKLRNVIIKLDWKTKSLHITSRWSSRWIWFRLVVDELWQLTGQILTLLTILLFSFISYIIITYNSECFYKMNDVRALLSSSIISLPTRNIIPPLIDSVLTMNMVARTEICKLHCILFGNIVFFLSSNLKDIHQTLLTPSLPCLPSSFVKLLTLA